MRKNESGILADIHVHRFPQIPMTTEFKELLSARRKQLTDDLVVGRAHNRYFPVISVLAPVMTQSEGEITYPGDPMCLYAALSLAVHRAVHDAGPVELAEHYNDLAPEWCRFPTVQYRLATGHSGYRPYGEDPNTDQTIFDPRVWDEEARIRWIRLLREVRPRVVLISTVSPAHRYALDMAGLVKIEVPNAFVILGGRHIDETVTCTAGSETLRIAPSSPLTVMNSGRVPRVIDALISGEAYHSLDLLMRAAALAMDVGTRWVDPKRVRSSLRELLQAEGPAPGKSLITLIAHDGVDAYPQEGSTIDLAALPSPYEAFAIRSRFPIFTDATSGEVQRTAHVMVSNSCPYHCNFCSETAQLAGGLKRFRKTATGIERVCEYIGYGAEALFFDDSIFWSGSFPDIADFCTQLGELRNTSTHSMGERFRRFLKTDGDMARLRNLQWGAQFTVDVLAALHSSEESSSVLEMMRDAGCTYIYIGIESMSTQVMDRIHKNLRRDQRRSWADKVREATSLVKSHGIRVGTSVLFGLDGETRASIDETIAGVEDLINEELIDLASPNILTYHPATPITRMHGMVDKLDYHSPHVDNRKPYIYFEEAFPGVVSSALTEDDLWYIHRETEQRWGVVRNDNSPTHAEDVEAIVG